MCEAKKENLLKAIHGWSVNWIINSEGGVMLCLYKAFSEFMIQMKIVVAMVLNVALMSAGVHKVYGL